MDVESIKFELKATASGEKIFCKGYDPKTGVNSNKYYQAHLTALEDGSWVAWTEYGSCKESKARRDIIRETVGGIKQDTWTNPQDAVKALNQRIASKHKKNYKAPPGATGDGKLV